VSDVTRFVRDFQEVVYTVGPDSVQQAICAWLYDHHDASFTPETTIKFCEGGSVAVVTIFASGMEARQGGNEVPSRETGDD
jgi:hypothetical protein